jgi:hypothetical protein
VPKATVLERTYEPSPAARIDSTTTDALANDTSPGHSANTVGARKLGISRRDIASTAAMVCHIAASPSVHGLDAGPRLFAMRYIVESKSESSPSIHIEGTESSRCAALFPLRFFRLSGRSS